MNELPDPRNVDWENKEQCHAFWDVCKTMTREEILSYEDRYTIPLLQHFTGEDIARLKSFFPEAQAWSEGVLGLTLDELEGDAALPFCERLSKMRGLPRLLAWSYATMKGIDDPERVKRIHRRFAPIVLEVFEFYLPPSIVANLPRP